ncbi:MAG: SRPBCC family protein [Candidatus Ranarchaeia archaeon]
MTWVVVEGIIDFTPSEVFELLCDYPRLAKSSPSISSIEYTSDVTRGVGTKTHWTVGVAVETKDGTVVEWDEEVTDWEKDILVGFRVKGDFPSVGFLRIYPSELGKKSFVVFGEHHPYEGANKEKIQKTMYDQLEFMNKELKGELKDLSHKRKA